MVVLLCAVLLILLCNNSEAHFHHGTRKGIKNEITENRIEKDCATKSLHSDEIHGIENSILEYQKHHEKEAFDDETEKFFQFSVHWHVIMNSHGEGNLTDSEIRNSIDVLNEGFSGRLTQAGEDCDGNPVSGIDMSIQFVLEKIDRTVDDEWFSLSFEDEEKIDSIGTALYDGNCSTLNVYTTKLTDELGLDTSVRGLASPSDICGSFSLRIWEFVFMDYRRVPKSRCDSAQSLDTLIHEVGHWMGLYHPFDNGGCEGFDFVDDTPQQDVVTGYCPVGSNSCPNSEGLDSIHNYMSYTNSCCQYTFTEGQKARSHDYLTIYRSEGELELNVNTTFFEIVEEEKPVKAPSCVDSLRNQFVELQCFVARFQSAMGI